MKQLSQEKLQSLYEAPPQALLSRIHDALGALPASEKAPAARKRPIGRLILAAATVMMLSAVVLTASGLLPWHTINWKGEPVETEEDAEVLSTPAPATAQSASRASFMKRAQAALNAAPQEDYTVASWGERNAGRASRERSRSFSTAETFLKAVADVDHLAIPRHLITGERFVDAKVILSGRNRNSYRLAEKREEDGLTIERYTVDEKEDVVIGYAVTLKASASGNGTIALYSRLHETTSDDQPFIGVQEGETAQSVNVPQMDYAISLTSDLRNDLLMKRTLDKPVSCFNEFSLMRDQDHDELIAYQEEHIRVNGRELDTQTLIGLFAIR